MFDLFISFIKITLSSFGGGAVIIALIQKEFVDTGIISPSDFIIAVGLTQMTPGPIAPAISAYVGYKLYGIVGVLITSFALLLPSLVIAFIIDKLFDKVSKSKIIEYVFLFLKPITVALVVSVFIFFLKMSVFNNNTILSLHDIVSYFDIGAAFIFTISLLCLQKFKLNIVYVVIICGLLGVMIL